ncbi:TetR/AcrR family transcriptional regulator [Streptomyces sp. NPDC059740]|uniref:TetR/AcrR family transcriptional regulator n=1 Tax=Streptomyces sp. NPDC059740 TaxID=3346926 RepID=UPI00366841C1
MAAGNRARPRESIWLSGGPTRRKSGEQPAGLDLDRIVDATVRLLDAEGAQGFSMRRLAAELGVTAMSVYWYVDSKDQLLELAVDAVCAEIELPSDTGGEGADWRAQLRHLANAYRRMLMTHQWMPRMLSEYLNVGPRALEFSNATLRVMQHCGLPAESVTGALSSLFQFVFGFATIQGAHEARCREAGVDLDEHHHMVLQALQDSGEQRFQETRRLQGPVLERYEALSYQRMREVEWDFALDLQIAGIEAMRDRLAGGPGPTPG